MNTGDLALLSMVYGVLRRISDYVQRSVSKQTGLVTALPATNVYYDYPVVTRLNVLGANVFRRIGDVAETLQRPPAEVNRQRRRQRALTTAVNRHLTRSDGVYVDGLAADGTPIPKASQTANACAVSYGVAPADRVGALARYVADLGMQTPPQTAAEVLRTMALAGLYDDLVARLVDARSDGWANILARGGTFTWEVWDPSDIVGDSMSHGWGSPVTLEIQRSLLGVRPLAPGFGAFEVSPPNGGLVMARGTVPTPRGAIAVGWSRSQPGGQPFSLELGVPPNAVATALVPAARSGDITEGGQALDEVKGIRFLGVTDGVARLEVAAGTYQIRSSQTS